MYRDNVRVVHTGNDLQWRLTRLVEAAERERHGED